MSDTMSETERGQLAQAEELFRPLKRAAWLGRLDGACYCIGGMLSLMLAIPGDVNPIGITLGAALLGIGLFERAAARRLLRDGERLALTRMAGAELAALAVLVAYFLHSMLVVPAISEELRRMAGDLQQLGIDLEAQSQQLTRILYPTLIAATLLFQGGMALAFLRRRADAVRYREEVPEWARTAVQSLGD